MVFGFLVPAMVMASEEEDWLWCVWCEELTIHMAGICVGCGEYSEKANNIFYLL